MGATKRLAEMSLQALNNYHKNLDSNKTKLKYQLLDLEMF